MTMDQGKKNIKKYIGKCECCGYKRFPQILTFHHMYPKRNGPQPTHLTRLERYLLLCPNCHILVELGIVDDKKLHKRVRAE